VGYIGVTPEAGFTTGLLDRFTSTTGTTVTLTHEISSENDIIVFVNFVKQDSTNYSVGGSGNKTLTLGGTLVSSDVVEVHYLNIVNQTSAPSAGSVGSSQITADVITGQTALAVAPDSTDELLISDAGSLKRIDVSLVGGKNTPAFLAYVGTGQNVSNSTQTLVQFNTELYDTDSDYDTSTYKFTPSVAGKYFFTCKIRFEVGSISGFQIRIEKNETTSGYTFPNVLYYNARVENYDTQILSGVLEANGSSDNFRVMAVQDSGGTVSISASNGSFFSAHRLIT